ncbi:MAG: phospho-N-acetylmuramoyl-pentapeptide-transferase [Lentisphaeria bacterium]|nr:phospho-N-acetylmuramoyl-pentapeptide-transferase [Lentisphaeria bacterium]
MLPYLATQLTPYWGPFRLLASSTVLAGLGGTAAAILVWVFLPRYFPRLPRDQGRPFVKEGEEARGKPTGAGFFLVNVTVPLAVLVVPPSLPFLEILFCLYVVMMCGYLDDCSETSWGQLKKGSLDLAVAIGASLALCQLRPYTLWLPLFKGILADGSFSLSPWIFVPIASVLLWLAINATNCSDGVDGLAGSLTLHSLFSLAGFLYLVVGHIGVARHLLIPHNPQGAHWAILVVTVAGGLGGYLWHNAKPSAVLMGDAGSRFLGLLVGVAVLASGNPVLILVCAPVVLVNGGSGLVKIALLRILKRLGFDAAPPSSHAINAPEGHVLQQAGETRQPVLIQLLHKVRFPLHDHCRRNMAWSDPQVLVRFMLVQSLLTPVLFVLLVKLR